MTVASTMVESSDTHCILRLAGDCSMASAAELKAALMEALAAAAKEDKDLLLDLGNVGEIDFTTWQLLWAARRAWRLKTRQFLTQAPDAVRALAQDVGFESLLDAAAENGRAPDGRPTEEGCT